MLSRLNGPGVACRRDGFELEFVAVRPGAERRVGARSGDRGEEVFYTCYGCHGVENYKNAYPDYSVPKLRHQHAAYIVAALHEYKSGERPHATMHAQASSLSDQDIEDIAAYLQGRAGEALRRSRGLGAEAGGGLRRLPRRERDRASTRRSSPKPPVLAGQHEDYLEQALTAYHNGRRKNVVMDGMAQLLATDEDIKVVAEYFRAASHRRWRRRRSRANNRQASATSGFVRNCANAR